MYQQQHALARHTAGDFPTEGIRTAPTPSLPPTPCLDSQSGFPGQRPQELEQKDGSAQLEDDSTQPEDDSDEPNPSAQEDSSGQGSSEPNSQDKSSPEHTSPDTGPKNNSEVCNGSGEESRTKMDEKQSEGVGAPPDIVSGTRDLSIRDGEEDTDSTKDLDVVSGSGGPSATPTELLDTPPDMPSTPPDMIDVPSSPDFDLPDAPDSEPGSPQVRAIRVPEV